MSKPLLMTVIVYSSVSPRSTAPPAWLFRSATVLVLVDRSGRTVAIDVTNAPIRTGSLLVFAPTVALVSPGATPLVTLMTSMSTPLMLSAAPVSCGRSPAFETAAPRYERVPLKNLFDRVHRVGDRAAVPEQLARAVRVAEVRDHADLGVVGCRSAPGTR